MSIPLDLLASTNFEAPCFCVYGGPGLHKSHSTHTLPYPILVHLFEPGGSASYLPWIARQRQSGDREWMTLTQQQREKFATFVNVEKVAYPSQVKPAPLIDVITYDNTDWVSYQHFVENMGNLDYSYYNSVVIDSLQEWSFDTRTFTKGEKNKGKLMNEIPFSWVQAQERANMALRELASYKRKGVCVYLIGAETISKDYVKSPMEKGKGEQAQEPYSIKGTVDLPGQLASGLGHTPDILMHARLVNNKSIWMTEPEMLPGGAAWWDAKDRWGRLSKAVYPNFRTIFDQLVGGQEERKVIYGAARKATSE